MLTIILILLFIVTVTVVTSFIEDKISKSLILCIVGFWFVILFFSSLNPLDLKEVSLYTYVLMLINIFSFVGGCCVIRVKKNISKSKFNIESIFSSKIFILLLLLSILIAAVMYNFQRTLLNDIEDLGYIRANFFELIFEGNLPLLIIYYFLLHPLYHVSLVLFSYLIFFNFNWKYLLLIVSYIGIFSLLGGGRAAFIIILLYCVLGQIVKSFISVNDGLKIISIPKFYYALLFSAMIISASLVTSKRVGENEMNLESLKNGVELFSEDFIIYTVGPIRACDYVLADRFVENNISDDFFLGLATFSGVDYLLDLVTKRIGINYASTHNKTRTLLQNTKVPISNNIEVNYTFTNVLYHYLDFGVFGVFLFPFLMGLFFRNIIKRNYRSPSLQKLIIIGFTFFILMQSPFTCYFNKLFTLPFILCLLIYDKIKEPKWKIR